MSRPKSRLALFTLMLVPTRMELKVRTMGQRNLRRVTGARDRQCPAKLLCLRTWVMANPEYIRSRLVRLTERT